VTDRTDRIDRADSTYRGGEICFCVCGLDGREGVCVASTAEKVMGKELRREKREERREK
jgi:hypothetical protein